MGQLTVRQETALWVVSENEPASVADVADHMLVSRSAARSALTRLERRGLVGRRYTGHHRGCSFAFHVTREGARLLTDTEGDDAVD